MKKLVLNNKEFIAIIEEHLNLGKTVSIKVKGNSMLPFFIDDKTLVDLKKDNSYKKYDVVLAKYHNKYVLHRIIKIKDDKITLRGDGNLSKEIIGLNNIYGKVISLKTNKKSIKNDKFKVITWNLLRPIRKVLLKIFKNK